MPMYNDPYGWWGGKWQAPTPMSVIQILESGSMDARLLATCWLTIERRGSVLIAADPMQDAGKTTTITAMLDFVPEEHWIVFPRGWYEDWAFTENEAVKNGQAVIAINEWSDHLASYMWGPGIRRCFDLMDTRRYSVITAMHDDTVEGVLEQLRDDVGVPARQLGHLTLVIILRLIRMNGRIHRRMATMHYLESAPDGPPRIVPAMRWDGAGDTHTHYDIADDLGPRLGYTPDAFRAELDRRTAFLTGLQQEGIRKVPQVRRALAAYRQATETGGDVDLAVMPLEPDQRDGVWRRNAW